MRWWFEKCEKFEGQHFRYGEIASPALAMLAENGETKKLEIDMKSSSQNIRSVIKARFLIVFFLQPCIADLDVFRMAMVHGFPFFDSKCLTHVDICDQGASAEIKRCWSNICGFPDGRHQTSFVTNLQNHSKVTVTKISFPHCLDSVPTGLWGFRWRISASQTAPGSTRALSTSIPGTQVAENYPEVIWLSLWLFIRHQLGSWIPWPWQFDDSPRSNSQVI